MQATGDETRDGVMAGPGDDLTIGQGSCTLNIRVGGILCQAGRVLLCRLTPQGYSILPGGRVKAMESSLAAIRRELDEEIGPNWTGLREVLVTENFFVHAGGEQFHEYCTYFAADWQGPADLGNLRTATEEFFWCPLEHLDRHDLKPEFMRQYIRQLPDCPDRPLGHVINVHNRIVAVDGVPLEGTDSAAWLAYLPAGTARHSRD